MKRHTRKTKVTIGVSCLALLAIAGCGSASDDTNAHPGRLKGNATLVRADGPMTKPSSDLDLQALGDGMTTLGYQMAQQLPSQNGNVVYSPASLAIAYAMVREGAAGTCAAQIDHALGLPANRQQDFNALLTALGTPGPSNTLTIGDAIFAQQGYAFKHTFLAALQRWYGAGVYKTTFPDAGKAAVNAYVDKQTHGLIPQLITDQFDRWTKMSLINTLYLHARWQRPFMAGLTDSSQFTKADGSTVSVPMMELPEQTGIDFAQGDSWKAVSLPYRGDRLAMIVLVPKEKSDPSRLLDPAVVHQAESGFAPTTVSVSLPRWSFGTDADLATLSRKLGMTAAFQPGGFPGITGDPTFRLDSVIQQARIQVGEKGTVAAAATQIEGIAGSAMAHVAFVDANHPFAYLIVDKSTGVPMFEGTVGDPSAH